MTSNVSQNYPYSSETEAERAAAVGEVGGRRRDGDAVAPGVQPPRQLGVLAEDPQASYTKADLERKRKALDALRAKLGSAVPETDPRLVKARVDELYARLLVLRGADRGKTAAGHGKRKTGTGRADTRQV